MNPLVLQIDTASQWTLHLSVARVQNLNLGVSHTRTFRQQK